jgi:hypothetical protein
MAFERSVSVSPSWLLNALSRRATSVRRTGRGSDTITAATKAVGPSDQPESHSRDQDQQDDHPV